jgi:hypothetical protein
MLSVIDVASPQRSLDVNLPWNDGYKTVYIKLGGDNVPRYIAPYYAAEESAFRAKGYRIGHYWVPEDDKDPVDSANYYVDNIRNWTPGDFVVLDNESFKGNDPDGPGPQVDSTLYTDAQAAAWVNQVKARKGIPGNQVFVYYGLNDARNRTHNAVLATGASFIIAAYSYGPFEFATPSNIPADRIKGHQTGGKVWGNIPTDINSFKDDAFAYTPTTPPTTPGGTVSVLTKAEQDQLWQTYAAIFRGGESMKDEEKSISQSLGEMHAILKELQARPAVDLSSISDALVAAVKDALGNTDVVVDYDRIKADFTSVLASSKIIPAAE